IPESGVGPTTTTTRASTTSTRIDSTTTSAPPHPTQPEKGFGAYFFFDGYPVEPGPYLVPVERSGGGGVEGALVALMRGVTAAESDMGLSTVVPPGTRVLGVEVVERVARVDLTREFESGGGSLSVLGRVAQIVYTATSFDEVDAVEFLIEGEPVEVFSGEGLILDGPQTRQGYQDLLPAIAIENPMWGASVSSVVDLIGTAVTASGEVRYVVVDADGLIVAEGMAAVGTAGIRSEFNEVVELTEVPHPGPGSIIVFEIDADGAQAHVLEYPLSVDG
ncbi:MAG: GerMN domain-containing protein, partial [Acidimicrobiia bacterium]